MNIAIIGRAESLYKTTKLLRKNGHNIKAIITAKEAPEYTKTSQDYEELANEYGALFINSAHINKTENITKIKDAGAIDVGISVNYINVISDEVVNLFPMGILNAHGGDLPKYRGNACQAWAIINGEKEIGLCVHKMEGDQLDSGDIIVRKFQKIDINTKVGECISWIEKNLPNMFVDAIEKLSENPNYVLEKQSTDPNKILRGYPRNEEDGEIDWNNSAVDILRQINACNKPFPGAYCQYNTEKLIIWDAELFIDNENYLATNGQVAKVNKNDGSIIIITGDGKLKINTIEYNNSVFKPADLIKSIRKRLK